MKPARQRYYSDCVTQITDPFYVCQCPAGHAFWSVTYIKKCHKCGKRLTSCIPADRKKAASCN